MRRLAETKDGRLTYCTAETGPSGCCRCGHVAHQQDGETIQDFLDRISDTVGVGLSLMYPPEIRALNDAVMNLDSVLEAHQAKLTVRSIGGYASYDLTWSAPLDIESAERIEPRFKEWIAAVGRSHSPVLEDDWLNDDSLFVNSVGDAFSQKCMQCLREHKQDLFEEDTRMPAMNCAKMFRLKPMMTAVMKAGLVNGERDRAEDADNLQKISRRMHFHAQDLWNCMRKYGLDRFMEKQDLAGTLYFVHAIDEEELH